MGRTWPLSLGADGTLGDSGWFWDAEYSLSTQQLDAQRLNVFDSTTVGLGLNTDGVSEAVIARVRGISAEECEAEQTARGGTRFVYSSFFGGNCTIYGPPPDPINPFGDLTQYVLPGLETASDNEQTQFEAQLNGGVFDLPGGTVALALGYDYRQIVLDTRSEFHRTGGLCSAIACPNESPVGALAFNTRISRDNHAGFVEGVVPFVGDANAMPGLQRLSLTFSARHDSYSNVEVEYRESESGEAGTAEADDPGSKLTWSTGLVYHPSDELLLKANRHTSFKVPQLNQLVVRVRENEPAAPFRGLFFTQPDDKGRTQTHENVQVSTGGNDQLRPELAETVSFSAEFTPRDGLLLKASYNDTEIQDRIAYFSSFFVDPNDLPSNVQYDTANDIYIRDDRWINVAHLESSSIDYELQYDLPFGQNVFSLTARRTDALKFKVQPDAANDEVQSLIKTRDDVSNDLDAILPQIPKYQSYLQLEWQRGGFIWSFDAQSAGRTSRIRSGGDDGRVYVTEPQTSIDTVVQYDFGSDTFFDAPAWMDDLRATLTVNNLTNVFAKNYVVDRAERAAGTPGHTEEFRINPFFEWTQGRAYRLAIHKSIKGF